MLKTRFEFGRDLFGTAWTARDLSDRHRRRARPGWPTRRNDASALSLGGVQVDPRVEVVDPADLLIRHQRADDGRILPILDILWRSSGRLRIQTSSDHSSILPLACKLIPLTT